MTEYLHPSIGETLLISLVGFTVVFMVLIVLMGLITVMSKLIGSTDKKVGQPVAVTAAPGADVSAPAAPAAPAGLILENVSEKEAAMIMAIVADELQKDPAELAFISIKEVKE